MNKMFLSGRLTGEPRFFPEQVGKDAVLQFSIANNKQVNGKKYTVYMNCSKFGRDAEKLSRILYKGVEVLVDGFLTEHRDDYGNRKYTLFIDSCEIMRHTKDHMDQWYAGHSSRGGVEGQQAKNNSGSEDDFMQIDPNEKMPWDV